jgi:hypothetical protein
VWLINEIFRQGKLFTVFYPLEFLQVPAVLVSFDADYTGIMMAACMVAMAAVKYSMVGAIVV